MTVFAWRKQLRTTYLGQNRLGQVGLSQVSSHQVGLSQVSLHQVRLGLDGFDQVQFSSVRLGLGQLQTDFQEFVNLLIFLFDAPDQPFFLVLVTHLTILKLLLFSSKPSQVAPKHGSEETVSVPPLTNCSDYCSRPLLSNSGRVGFGGFEDSEQTQKVKKLLWQQNK